MPDLEHAPLTTIPEPASEDRLVETRRYLVRFDRASAWMRVVETYENRDGFRRHRVQDWIWPGL